jgi:PAS domain S-box-containing protein
MKSSAIHFITIFDSVPIPGLVIDYAHEHKIIRYANKAFLENAEIELANVESQKAHDLLNHLYFIDDKGEHIELDKVLYEVFTEKKELDLFILRTSEQNGVCRLEDNFNRVRLSNLVMDDDEKSMCISVFFHKSGYIPFQEISNSSLGEKLVCTVDTKGIITSVDNISVKTWGYTEEDLLGVILVNLLPNESRIYSWELFLEMLKKMHTISTDRTMYLKDKTIIPVNFTAVWDEEKQLINGVVKDLRKKAETEYDFVMNEHRLRSLIKGGLDLIAIVTEEGLIKYLSPNFSNATPIPLEEFIGKNAFLQVHPDDLTFYQQEFTSTLSEQKVKSSPHRVLYADGSYRWYESIFTNLINDPSIQGIVINSRDITDSYIANRMEQLERNILEKNALPNSNLRDIATDYIRGIESLHVGMICSLLSVQNSCVYNIASPSLHLDYINLINGLEIGENRGSCGTAAYTKQPVIVTDIETDIRWADFKTIVQPYGYKACWSMPIIDSNNEVIATFAVYYKESKEPNSQELLTINRSVQILRVIIENYRRLEDINKANERFKLAAKATLNVIWDWDVLTDKMFWSNGILDYFGYYPDDLSNDSFTWEKYIHPEDLIDVKESIQFALKSESDFWEKEYRFLKSTGEYSIVLDRGFIVRDRDENPQRMVGSITDITYERNLQSLLENASRLAKMGSWEVDLVNSKVYYSKITREIHELDDSFEPTVENGVNFYKEGYSREAIMNAMSDAVMKGLSWDIELELTTAKGNNRWVRAMGEPEFIEGNCVRLYGNFQDINDRKLAELKLQELNETLENRAQQLAVSNDELQQFAYVSSHDLQEPLRMVTSFLTLLEKKYGDQLDEKATQYIHYAVDGAQRMRHVILDLLEYSRVGSNEEALKKIDLKILVEEILILHRKQIQEIEASFVIDPLPTINSFETPIRQVFQNLISNSLKYHSTENKPLITLGSIDSDTHYEFSVADNGIGIDEQFKDKIFQIFQRLHTKDKYSGTGVGLAICKKVMDNIGGDIWLDTEYKDGAKFCFKIPKNKN